MDISYGQNESYHSHRVVLYSSCRWKEGTITRVRTRPDHVSISGVTLTSTDATNLQVSMNTALGPGVVVVTPTAVQSGVDPSSGTIPTSGTTSSSRIVVTSGVAPVGGIFFI
jgi:hypothetical protein